MLSRKRDLDPGVLVAVLCVESAGKGFERDNQNRPIIRFENHKFWTYWGKQHPDVFHQHFQFGATEKGRRKVWLGHKWRPSRREAWQTFHGSQVKEWRGLEFARSLDDTAALLSISMGALQIMGFHYKRIGCETVQEMFDRFDEHIRYHILGLFDFLDNNMRDGLKRLDFVTFVAAYEGSGRKERYGGLIRDHYQVVKRLLV